MKVTETKLAELKQLRKHRDSLIHAQREAQLRYQQEIEVVEAEIGEKEKELFSDGGGLAEPEGPWNVEHEGIVHSDGSKVETIYEREYVFDNTKE